MGDFPQIFDWLTVNRTQSNGGRYEHLLGKEVDGARATLMPAIRTVVAKAHEDARRRLMHLATGSLDPLAGAGNADPLPGYPHQLPLDTRKGYFGEIMAGAVAENLDPFGHADWSVPAHLFRFHTVAFQQLDRVNQTGETLTHLPGRTGDDCLAFRHDDNWLISATMCCEAKCTANHDTGQIAAAHEKSSLDNPNPVDLLQVIEVLNASTHPDAPQWVKSLRLFKAGTRAAGYERFDQVTYICGQHPIQNPTWIDTLAPHASYTANRHLHVAELHLRDVDALIEEAYREEDANAPAR
jgi:hypothetical protein